MREFIGCDSLAFISVEGLRASVRSEHRTVCEACFTGRYVVELPDYLKKTSFLASAYVTCDMRDHCSFARNEVFFR